MSGASTIQAPPRVSVQAPPRVVIQSPAPAVDAGSFPAKRCVGDTVEASADIFADGHELLHAVVRYRAPGRRRWQEAALRRLDAEDGGVRWGGEFVVDAVGRWQFTFEAWVDGFASWRDELRRKVQARQPELELLRFFGEHGFESIAALHGWYEYDGRSLAATLGVVQEFVPGAVDGWQLALDGLAAGKGEAEWLIAELGALGAVTGEPDREPLQPIIGHGEDVRELLAGRSNLGVGGRVIRTHGDYHLGQTLHAERGWVVIDFEGEPSRPLSERRQKRSALRDVAGMLRSFAYATSAVEILRGRPAPAGFEARAREAFLEGYLAAVDPSLLPPGEAAVQNLLAIYELEKAVYELAYELDNRPDWVSIPVAGIRRLLEAV